MKSTTPATPFLQANNLSSGLTPISEQEDSGGSSIPSPSLTIGVDTVSSLDDNNDGNPAPEIPGADQGSRSRNSYSKRDKDFA